MIYQCEKCNKYFNHKAHYMTHINRKTSCIKINDIDKSIQNENSDNTVSDSIKTVSKIVPNSIETVVETVIKPNSKLNGYTCVLCNKTYKHTQSLTTHKKLKHPNYDEEIKNIKTRTINDTNILQQLKETKKENQQIKQELINMKQLLVNKKKKSKTKIINNNNGTINNNNITINIIPYTSEEASTLLNSERNHILFARGYDPIDYIAIYTNFNDAHPEQKNILLKNLRSKYIDVHNGKKWIKQLTEPIIKDVFDNYMYMLQQLYESCNDIEKPLVKKIITKLIEDYNKFYKLKNEGIINKTLQDFVNETKEQVKLIIYNKSKEELMKQKQLENNIVDI